MRFDEILENDNLLDALYDMHFEDCTPIQEKAIPVALEGRDVLACAQTGTGKTAAYLLPIVEQLVDDGYPSDCVNCIIMAPTRELAQQIDQQMQGIAYFMPVTSVAVYGGTNGEAYDLQRKSLKHGADIVIATPGRLLAHISMGHVDLSKVSFFVLDEADRMLDMGFYDDIMQIVNRIPRQRQTLLFSATMPAEIQRMAKTILTNPVEIKIAVSKPADKIEQLSYILFENQKLLMLQRLLTEENYKKVIIFASSKLNVKELAKTLRKKGMSTSEMHSDLDQKQREDVMFRFKAGQVNFLVATDILSRGIDIDDIELVVNYDVPREAEDYIHRVGRTARADRKGKAVTLVTPRDFGKLRQIERLLEKEIPRGEVPADLGPTPEINSGSRKTSGSRKKKSGRRINKSDFVLKGGIKENPRKKSSGKISPDKSTSKK